MELGGSTDLRSSVDAHRSWVAEQVLATDIRWPAVPAGGDGWVEEVLADGSAVSLKVTAASALH